MPVAARQGHARVRAAIAEDDLAAGRVVGVDVALQLRIEHPSIESLGLAGIATLAEGGRR